MCLKKTPNFYQYRVVTILIKRYFEKKKIPRKVKRGGSLAFFFLFPQLFFFLKVDYVF